MFPIKRYNKIFTQAQCDLCLDRTFKYFGFQDNRRNVLVVVCERCHENDKFYIYITHIDQNILMLSSIVYLGRCCVCAQDTTCAKIYFADDIYVYYVVCPSCIYRRLQNFIDLLPPKYCTTGLMETIYLKHGADTHQYFEYLNAQQKNKVANIRTLMKKYICLPSELTDIVLLYSWIYG
jgi:hypothetical protein